MMRRVCFLVIGTLWSLPANASRQFLTGTDVLRGGSSALPLSGTYSFMVNPQFTLNDGLFHCFFEVADIGATKYFQIIGGPTARIYAAWKDGTSMTEAIAMSPAFAPSTWHTVTVTWVNGGTLALYLNGTQIAAAANTHWFSTAGLIWSFGNRATGGLDARSQLARQGLWNRVLAPSELSWLALGNLPSTIPAGLVAEYDLPGASLAAQAGTGGTLAASGTIAASDPPVYVPPSPALTLSGPASGLTGTSGWTSPYFSVAETALARTTVITPSDGGGGGTFSPATVTLTTAIPEAIFQYLPASTGTKLISITNDQGISNPAPISYTVSTLAALSSDVSSRSVPRGTDAVYNLSVTAGSSVPRLAVGNLPARATFAVSGLTCTAAGSTQWSDCGTTANGTYALKVHTTSVAPGTYYFTVSAAVPGSVNASGVTLTLVVTSGRR